MRSLRISLAALLLLSPSLFAKEKLLRNGLSPDKATGIYLVMPARAEVGDSPSMEIRREKDHKVLGELDCDAYLSQFDSIYEDVKVAWAPDSQYFAYRCRTTKTSSSIEVYCRATKSLLKLPDYYAAIAKRIPGAPRGRYSFADSLSWKGNELRVQMSGNTSNNSSNPEDFPEDWYVCTVVFRIKSSKDIQISDVIVHKKTKAE